MIKYINIFLFFLIFAILAFFIPVKQIPKERGAANVLNQNLSNASLRMLNLTKEPPKELKEIQENNELNLTGLKQKIADANLEAKSVYVYDLKTENEIFSKNSEISLPLASLAKLMTAVVAQENLGSESKIFISKNALTQEGKSGFYLNEEWQVKDLIDIMLVNSSNDAAEAISEAINEKLKNDGIQKDVVKLMNEKAAELNMKNTVYFNSTGLDITDEKAGAYGTAKDIFKLLNYILKNHPAFFQKTTEKSFTVYSVSQIQHTFLNTNLSLNSINQFIGGKTGFTDMAKGNLVVIFDVGFNRPIAVVILGSSFDGRFKDAEKIAKIIYEH